MLLCLRAHLQNFKAKIAFQTTSIQLHVMDKVVQSG
jgi:hypothetical protein